MKASAASKVASIVVTGILHSKADALDGSDNWTASVFKELNLAAGVRTYKGYVLKTNPKDIQYVPVSTVSRGSKFNKDAS